MCILQRDELGVSYKTSGNVEKVVQNCLQTPRSTSMGVAQLLYKTKIQKINQTIVIHLHCLLQIQKA